MEIVANNYKKGDAFPLRTNLSLLRIYNYQPNPFAERVLLVLKAKNIEHEVINVDLRNKPEWFLQKNPSGEVPTIEFSADGKTLAQSLIIGHYFDENYETGPQLRAADPYQRARDKMFIDLICPHLSIIGKVLHSKEDVSVLWESAKDSLQKGENLLKERKIGRYLSGDGTPGLTDYMIWPIIERIPIAIEILSEAKPEEYMRKELPTIDEFRQQMLSNPTVQKVCLNYQKLLDFCKAIRQLLLSTK